MRTREIEKTTINIIAINSQTRMLKLQDFHNNFQKNSNGQ